MHYLIDGHNLIGKMPNIQLDDPDDEVKLVQQLRSWAAGGRKRQVTVVFDKGLPGGQERGLSSGNLNVLFASKGQTADAILIRRIRQARNPKEFTLVSSDRTIIEAAEARRMPVWRSEEFVNRMGLGTESDKSPMDSPPDSAEKPELGPGDLDMWLNIFTPEDSDDL